MTVTSIGRIDSSIAVRSNAVPLLQFFALTLMVFPADEVLKAAGGGGYVAALVSFVMLLAWIAATLFGLHNPFEYHYPVRIALCALWLVSLASYVLMNRVLLTTTQLAGADRWLIQLAGVSGVILVTAECLHSLEDIRRVLRALIWGGAFCGIVAGLQFKLKLDITRYLTILPGFSLNQATAADTNEAARNGLARVAGTASQPIELGVVAGMLLVLAVYLAMHDVERPRWQRYLPVICIAIAIPASVSRSAILAVGIAVGVLLVSLPAAQRLKGFAIGALGVAAVFVTAHGLIGTIANYFLSGTSDPSVAHRVNNYNLVEHLVQQTPWFGQGPDTYIVQNQVFILDNEYLTTVIELGLVGLVALTFFLVWPGIAALVARRRTADPELRDLCAALAGASFAAVVCSATFDSLSFPMFVNVQALIAGLVGAVWLLVEKEGEARPRDSVLRTEVGRN